MVKVALVGEGGAAVSAGEVGAAVSVWGKEVWEEKVEAWDRRARLDRSGPTDR